MSISLLPGSLKPEIENWVGAMPEAKELISVAVISLRHTARGIQEKAPITASIYQFLAEEFNNVLAELEAESKPNGG